MCCPLAAAETLTLEESIDIALKNSLTVDMAREEIKGAEAQRREAITGFLPQFSTSYNYARLNEAPFTRFQGMTGILSIMNGIEIPVGTKNNYTWSVEARQPLFTGGGLTANYQANKIGKDIALTDEVIKTQDVIHDVKIAYYDILRTQKIEEAAGQSVEMLAAHRDIAQNYFRVGMIPKNDLLYAEVELANAEQALVRTQNAVQLAKARFNTVLKRNLLTPVNIADILKYEPHQKSLAECWGEAIQNRPELKKAALKTMQAEKLVHAAQSEYFPTLSLVADYGRFGDNPSLDGSDFKDAENWSVMGVAHWNFWEWGKTKFRVDASKTKENQALDVQKDLQDQIALEINHAYLNLQEAEKQIAVSKKVIEQAEENFRIAEERYKERVGTSTEVLDAQTLLTRAKSEYANALGNYNIYYTKLQRAMGILRR
jgi:outer membrane protein TolC